MFNFEYHKGIIKLQLKFLGLNLYFKDTAAASIEFFIYIASIVFIMLRCEVLHDNCHLNC